MISTVEKKLTASDGKAVLDFLAGINLGHPFPEHESYYSRSSHSDHSDKFCYLHERFREIFKEACNETGSLLVISEAYQLVASDLEKLFIVGYALSAVYDELHSTDGMTTTFFGSGHPKWFHGPFPGGWVTLNDQMTGDPRVPIGWVAEKTIKTDPLIVAAYEAYKKANDEFYMKAFRHGDDGYAVSVPDKNTEFRAELARLHGTLRGIMEQLINRMREHC